MSAFHCIQEKKRRTDWW